MFVTLAKYNDLRRILAGESKRRQEAEQQLEEKTAAVTRLQARLAHDRDEHPDTPVPVQPATGDARLVQQLNLSERARRHLDEQCLTLHWTNVVLERELAAAHEQLAALQTAPGVAS
ncbi:MULTISPECIES: hypothetical protein [unclassified Streptomyces]|uniref:hypothetical protein n=1 Tax=unclassified Streptomyces TaxID=2593676 RepID=UPI0004C9C9E8|nr:MULTISPECIES: hypothetical protein [unclassified Streptomyces]KOV86104.1 hypothetical protein ADL02_19655 [Streptomyces sp. NRRL WC-3723]